MRAICAVRLGLRFLGACTALLASLALAEGSLAQDPAATAPVVAVPEAKAKAGGRSDFVRVLSASDFSAYQTLFKAAGQGDLASVQAGLAALQNKLLMGHLLARTYLAPAGSVDAATLKGWLDLYPNYPESTRIHALAIKKGADQAQLKTPERRIVRGSADDVPDLKSEIGSETGQAAARKVREMLNNGEAGAAQAYLFGEAQSTLSASEFNQLAADVAAGLFYSGRIEPALQAATHAAQAREHAPLADWIAGLTNWRLKNYAQAASHFAAMAQQPEMTSWLKSAAGFWAGRAYIAAGEPHQARAMLEIASSKPRTFYGLVAMRLLGESPSFSWAEPNLDPKGFQRVARLQSVARAVALNQLGMRLLAEDVMLRAAGKIDASDEGPFIALAGDMGFASAQFFAASAARSASLKAAAYPIMRVQPKGGYQVDPALIHAIVRQESRFETDVESTSGARGLMQILPSTAARVIGDASIADDGAGRLFDPVLNLSVGQRYIRKMMTFASPDGNLFQTAVAYNGGPGNLQKWLAQVDHGGDPLLWIESLPSRETRGYVERVMANMWIYQMRLGRATPTLDQVAQGQWPIYVPGSTKLAER